VLDDVLEMPCSCGWSSSRLHSTLAFLSRFRFTSILQLDHIASLVHQSRQNTDPFWTKLNQDGGCYLIEWHGHP